MKNFVLLFLAGIILLFAAGCSDKYPVLTDEEENASTISEFVPVKLEITPELIAKKPEFSGLEWYKDNLLLIPQFPNRINSRANGAIPYIPRDSVVAAIEGKIKILQPLYYKLVAAGLEQFFNPGSGFEAAAVHGDDIYFTIESVEGIGTTGFIVKGKIDDNEKTIVLSEESLREIQQIVEIYNFADETIIYNKGNLYTLFEANGRNVNPYPVSHIFSESLDPLGAVPSATIEFRITDATATDKENRFWALNYFYPGEADKLHPDTDSLVVKYGVGESHRKSDFTERLVEFEIKWNKIELTDSAPVVLKLSDDNKGRNWEGLARLDGYGFLLATDSYPESGLYFVKFNP